MVLVLLASARAAETDPPLILHPSQSPSEKAFGELWRRLHTHPAMLAEQHAQFLDDLDAYNRRYPGSSGSFANRAAVRLWAEKGLITPLEHEEAERAFLATIPGLRELETFQDRMSRPADFPPTQAIAKASALAERYEGSYVGFVAASVLPGLHLAAGDEPKAFESVRGYLERYPVLATDFRGADGTGQQLLFTEIQLTGRLVGVDEAARKYWMVVERYGGRRDFGVRALYEGATLLAAAERYDDAISMHRTLIERYPDTALAGRAHTEIGNLLYKAGHLDAAREHFTRLAEGGDAEIAERAQGWLRFIDEHERQQRLMKLQDVVGESPANLADRAMMRAAAGVDAGEAAVSAPSDRPPIMAPIDEREPDVAGSRASPPQITWQLLAYAGGVVLLSLLVGIVLGVVVRTRLSLKGEL